MKYLCYFLVRIHLKEVKLCGLYHIGKKLQVIPQSYNV